MHRRRQKESKMKSDFPLKHKNLPARNKPTIQYELITKSTSTPDTLECASESGFWTNSKRSVFMRIDALWRIYTIQLAHNLAAIHGQRHSVIMLYRERKVQSCEGFGKEWFDRQHTDMSLLY